MKNTIGENAGKVWKALEKGDSTPAKLKKAVKLEENTLWIAIGWLAREDKVELIKSGNSFKIGLK